MGLDTWSRLMVVVSWLWIRITVTNLEVENKEIKQERELGTGKQERGISVLLIKKKKFNRNMMK